MTTVKTIVAELEGKIAEAECLLAKSEKQWPLSGSIIDEQDELRRIIKELKEKLTGAKNENLRRTFGLHDEGTAGGKHTVSRVLTAPQRIFVEGERKQYPSKLDYDDASKQYQAIHTSMWDSDACEKTEDQLQGFVNFFTKQNSNRHAAFTQGMYGAIIGTFARIQTELDALREFSGLKRREIEARIASLEADRKQLRTDISNFKYCGVWKSDAAYAKGNSVTDSGSLWIALEDTVLRPGQGASWQLAVKRGRDGRELR